jgi:transcriptional regulator with XRE-family HTH domain
MTPKSFNKAMGAVIRRHRQQRGLSQGDIGKALGVSYQQVQKSETGLNCFAAHYLPVLAELFGLTIGDLYKQAGIQAKTVEPSPADNDAFLAARYVAKISSDKLRRNIIDFARKCAYEGASA